MGELPPELSQVLKNPPIPYDSEGLSRYLGVIVKYATSSNLYTIFTELAKTNSNPMGNDNFTEVVKATCTSKEMLDIFYSFCLNWEQHMPFYYLSTLNRVLFTLKKEKDFVKSLSGKTLTTSEIYFLHGLSSDPFFYSAAPDVYKQIKQKFEDIKSKIKSYKKACFIPVVEDLDSTDPRVSKFGGRAPYLPKNGPNKCQYCQSPKSTIFSFYVESLPAEIQRLFPSDSLTSVLVGYGCEECCDFDVVLYNKDEIDHLIYDEIDSDNIFNENRVITGWEESFMYPTSSDVLKKLDPEMPSCELNIADIILESHDDELWHRGTYLGGYPIFDQGDDQPPDTELLLEMEESEQSTNQWGDCGTAQVWMTTGKDFGVFKLQFACG
ncbi:hypothetical protein GPJ56_000199 [Histomonas meleagridis]|uniref:uncharacterized protein n=1 Tax=Histomonas meleagridis TaxID=135588 RepID=UPI003559A94A|nr:hypothetical protein GPJ56_000199 [Histomonas meleagridis]KAH0799686.1 hypothetical protein GO595_007407 [Histomonas meleagridis]